MNANIVTGIVSRVGRIWIRIAGIARESKGTETENVTKDPTYSAKSMENVKNIDRRLIDTQFY